ncbi:MULTISPECIES: hypothetical protein [unclassified Bradyrhizobium]|uniref:hypothetical protein n=1 Tax=unclassified Bradyrhizobium TaxID=2631580 RepID=UPI00211E80EE|nr:MULTISPECIES: hypothetical protein [unclassified Bradyrhizobium]MDD1534601.1 hypothetical protein [Bradyrhizobium sp. WBOS8]MDD1581465.1 hypothetical protein [Bradyrhizobium sp. WBOS4]UUO49751.1 hypothetical protein DCM78_24265 [Bradyrhizobium sp. WBOS04]UUO58517.1 hypothetical protein DCM80_04545 [Bradyrhizobium sp. WBOS08]
MNVNDWAPWVAIGLSVVSMLYSIVTGRSKENDKRFAHLQEQIHEKANKDTVAVAVGKLDLLEDRATRIETNMDHLPDHQMVTTLQGMIGKLTGDVAVLSERIRPIASIADRLQEKILEQAGFDR